ncbi:MAG: putative acetyltransferase [Lentisphaerae bacterium ADurb.BinA184]|nr:MAG: putative acetyltransferase [Lentisphaerae bacterium ADurb.BinA184]
MPSPSPAIRWSQPTDRDAILALIRDTGFFRDDEIEIAREVLDDALRDGPSGDYQSYTALLAGRPVGWVCFGHTPCTIGTYDIYWIAVDRGEQGKGIGRALLQDAESRIAGLGGRISVLETSGRGLYDSTRGFYLKLGYIEEARLREFYAPGDDKVVYTKRLGGGQGRG